MTVKFTKASFEDNYNVDLWPRWYCKYFDINKATAMATKMGNEPLHDIIRDAPYQNDRQKTLIDIRTQYLQPGFISTQPHWHLDTWRDPQAIHHLYIIGENRTRFEINGEIKTMPQGYYATYGPDDWHQGVEVMTEEFRLFVRIQEVDDLDVEQRRGLYAHYPVRFPIGKDPTYDDEQVYYNRFAERQDLNKGRP